jgi:hypothetical protein
MIRVVSLLTLLFALSGCYSLPSTHVDDELAPTADSGVAYLVGVVGIWPKAAYTAQEQMLMIRPRGSDDFATARLHNQFYARTPRDVRETGHGIGSLFVMRLKPGRYEIYNLRFDRGTQRFWSREDFTIGMQLEAGKAYYIGDFRGGCLSPTLGAGCVFLHSDHLERDAALVRANYPQVPALQKLDLPNIDTATPFIREENGPSSSVYKSLLSGKL